MTVTRCATRKSARTAGVEKSLRGMMTSVATGRDGAVDVLHGHVEVKGSLVCHAILVRKGEGLDERVDEADDCTVAHDDALGCFPSSPR